MQESVLENWEDNIIKKRELVNVLSKRRNQFFYFTLLHHFYF